MDPDTLNFSDSILPEAPQDLHPLQTTQHLEVIHRVTVTDIIDFRLEEHFTGNLDPVFGRGSFPASDLLFCSEDGGTTSGSSELVTTQQCSAGHHKSINRINLPYLLESKTRFFP